MSSIYSFASARTMSFLWTTSERRRHFAQALSIDFTRVLCKYSGKITLTFGFGVQAGVYAFHDACYPQFIGCRPTSFQFVWRKLHDFLCFIKRQKGNRSRPTVLYKSVSLKSICSIERAGAKIAMRLVHRFRHVFFLCCWIINLLTWRASQCMAVLTGHRYMWRQISFVIHISGSYNCLHCVAKW